MPSSSSSLLSQGPLRGGGAASWLPGVLANCLWVSGLRLGGGLEVTGVPKRWSLRRIGERRRRRKRRGIAGSAETCSQWRQRLSLSFQWISLSAVEGETKAEWTAVTEAQVVGVGVRVESADTLQRPEEQRRRRTSGSRSTTASNFNPIRPTGKR